MTKLERKTIIGHKVRRFRQNQNLTQTEMAAMMDISPSYLNLIEHNQRPVTVSLLFRLGQTFDVDLKAFAEDTESRFAAELNEVFADSLFQEYAVKGQEIQDLTACAPTAAQAVIKLYQIYRQMWETAQHLADESGDRELFSTPDGRIAPVDEVRDFLQEKSNYFATLEDCAERLSHEHELVVGKIGQGLSRILKDHHGIEVKIMPVSTMGDIVRRYDAQQYRILISEVMLPERRTFQIAVQYALLAQRESLEQIVTEAGLTSQEARNLLRYALANYFAGAITMPYGAFLASARETRYDIELLRRRFETSFEQVSHRLTTLQKPGERGVSFFFLRVDNAGNVSKRLSGGGFHFARFGGTCPRWIVHNVFSSPGKIFTQIIRMPDRTTFLTIARTAVPASTMTLDPVPWHAIAVGCDIRDAKDLVYGDRLDPGNGAHVTPVGISCKLCERLDCDQRAFPPLNRPLKIDENVRRAAPFSFTD